MIAIQFQKRDFEYDVYNLVKSFYPQETVSMFDEDVPADVYDEKVSLFYGENRIRIRMETFGKDEDTLEDSAELPDGAKRKVIKNELKILLYRMLSRRTGKELPWGTLTGVRPTKIPMALLEEGHTNVETADIMRKEYLVSREKTALAIAIANRERYILDGIDYKNGYSVYVGIPFCPSICAYCSFSSSPLKVWKKRVDEYLDALCFEIRETAGFWGGRAPDTVYIGGGTPTTLEPEQMDRLLCELERQFDLTRVREFTVEAGRPDSIDRAKLEVIRRHPVTRISINPQTMNQKTLDIIGRKHSVEDIRQAYRLARTLGFDNINMDLIVGLPGEEPPMVERTLKEIEVLDPDSITIHSLAIKRAARLNLFRDEYKELSVINSKEIMDMAAACAGRMGMSPYYLYRQKNMAGNFENVGYARPGKEGIYNILIMEEKQSILAFGAGASTKVVLGQRIERVENVKDINQYILRMDEMIERKRRAAALLSGQEH